MLASDPIHVHDCSCIHSPTHAHSFTRSFQGADSGSISASGVAVGNVATNLRQVTPGSSVQVGNAANVDQQINTGDAGSMAANFFGPFLLGGGGSGSIVESGTASSNSFDGSVANNGTTTGYGAHGNNFAGSINVGNANNQTNIVQTGDGGIGFTGMSGSIAMSGTSVGQSYTAGDNPYGVVIANVGNSNGGGSRVVTAGGTGFGTSGSIVAGGNAVGGGGTA